MPAPMFPASTKQDGKCLAPLDVCQLPPPSPPIFGPFVNIAMCQQANPGTCTKKVKILGQPALTKDSQIPMSSGDEAGSVGGAVSKMIKGPCVYKSFSSKVKWEGANAVCLLCKTSHNRDNAPLGNQVTPSQDKVKIAM